jgi:MFS transporter, OFA family, oxalate/formate antiporter
LPAAGDLGAVAFPLQPSIPLLETAKKGLYYGYYLVAVAFVAQFVSAGSQNYVTGPFLKPMTTDLDWSRSEYQLARTIGQFAMALIGLYVGGLVDRRGGRLLMQGGAVVLGASLFATSFVQTQWQWLLVNGLAVTTGAALIGNLVVNVTLSKWFVEKRGRAVGFSSMGVSFAGVALVPAVTALVDQVGWRMSWQVLGVAIFALIFPVSFLMRRAPEDYGLHPDGKSDAEVARGGGRAAAADMASSMTRRQALRTRSFYFIVFAYGFGALSIGVMLAQTVPYMTDAGHSRTFAAFMITVTSLPAMFTKPLWGYLVDKIDPRWLSATGFLINAVAMVLIVFSVKSGITPLIVPSFFLLGFGWGGLIPLQEVVWASFFGRRYLGSVRSAGLPFALIVGASAPYLSTLYFDRIGNYDGAFLIIAGFAIFATTLILLARKPLRVAALA